MPTTSIDEIIANIPKDKIYHKEPSGVIICADCLEILPLLPDKSVDLVLTDPPYGINGGKGGTPKLRKRGIYIGAFTSRDDTTDYIKNVTVTACKICLTISKAMILTPGNKNFTYYPQPDSFGSLIQEQTGSIQRWGWCDSQPIFYYGISPLQGKKMEPCSFKMNTSDECGWNHPCPKPLSIWKKMLIKGSGKKSDLVLDPFLGSGTTAVAAKQLGRKFIGIEICPEYCEIAKQRLAQEILPL